MYECPECRERFTAFTPEEIGMPELAGQPLECPFCGAEVPDVELTQKEQEAGL